jgi:hypothetical protein
MSPVRRLPLAAALVVGSLACAQMRPGTDMPGFAETFGVVPGGRERHYTARFVKGEAPGNVLWPGEQASRFSFRVNDNASGGCLELSRRRSVAKRNGSFHVDWVEHWANEVGFAFE